MIDERAVRQAAGFAADLFAQLAASVVVEPLPAAKCALAGALPPMAAATAAIRWANAKCANAPVHPTLIDPLCSPMAVWRVADVRQGQRDLCGRMEACLTSATDVDDDGVVTHLLQALDHVASARSQVQGLACGEAERRAGARYGLQTFAESTDYRSVRGEYAGACLEGHAPPSTERLLAVADQARIQRDELDAVETFARVLSATELGPTDQQILADMACDEARHVRIGQRLLVDLGLDPGRLSVSTGGVALRADLTPLGSMAQNVAVGEVTNLAEMRRAVGWAREAGLAGYADALTAIIRDERAHIRFGIDIVRRAAARGDDATRQEVGAWI
jgi:hypothetical protein